MPTVIHMERLVDDEWVPVDISTSEFASVRSDDDYRIIDNDPEKAFSEFRDNGPRGSNAFFEDVISAIKDEKFGPSWDDFIECLVNGSLFAIITARGHEPKSIAKGIEYIIDDYLTDDQKSTMYMNLIRFEYQFGKDIKDIPRKIQGKPSDNGVFKRYISHCDLVGISAPSRGGDTSNPEKEKEKALLDFKQKVNKWAGELGVYAKIGFSDDDLGNVRHMEDLIKNLDHEEFTHIKEYVIKNTNDPNDMKKIVRKIESNANTFVGGTPGLQSSLVGFKDFGKLSDNIYTDSENSTNSILKKSSKELAKVSKELEEEEDVKKKKNSIESKKKKKDIMEHLKNFGNFNESSKDDLATKVESAKKDVLTKEDLEKENSGLDNSYTLEAVGNLLKDAGIDARKMVEGHRAWSCRLGGPWKKDSRFLLGFKEESDFVKMKSHLDKTNKEFEESVDDGRKYPYQVIVSY